MRNFWLSTPGWTCLVRVDAGGMIRHAAPYLRRRWVGKAWAQLLAQTQQRYGAHAVQVRALGQEVSRA